MASFKSNQSDLLEQACFLIDERDNVYTALTDLQPGKVKVNGGATGEQITIPAPVARGHKVARFPVSSGEAIIKYGVVIGEATAMIAAGEWVHLHNCKSRYDERSSKLDVTTGAPTDTRYE